MRRVTIRLESREYQALWALARTERRDKSDQAAILIRMQLVERGFLLPAPRESTDHPDSNREEQDHESM